LLCAMAIWARLWPACVWLMTSGTLSPVRLAVALFNRSISCKPGRYGWSSPPPGPAVPVPGAVVAAAVAVAVCAEVTYGAAATTAPAAITIAPMVAPTMRTFHFINIRFSLYRSRYAGRVPPHWRRPAYLAYADHCTGWPFRTDLGLVSIV